MDKYYLVVTFQKYGACLQFAEVPVWLQTTRSFVGGKNTEKIKW